MLYLPNNAVKLSTAETHQDLFSWITLQLHSNCGVLSALNQIFQIGILTKLSSLAENNPPEVSLVPASMSLSLTTAQELIGIGWMSPRQPAGIKRRGCSTLCFSPRYCTDAKAGWDWQYSKMFKKIKINKN